MIPVVTVQHRYPRAPGEGIGAVHPNRLAHVALIADGAEPMVAAEPFRDDGPGGIAGGIVDDDHLNITQGLVQSALERPRQRVLTIEGRNDNRRLGRLRWKTTCRNPK